MFTKASGIFILFFLLIAFFISNLAIRQREKINIDPIPIHENSQTSTNVYKKGSLNILWTTFKNTDTALFSNLPAKELSSNLVSLNNCENLVSGGFYSKEDKHIGLFISNGEVISKSKESTLYNGFFYINDKSQSQITKELPLRALYGLQAGPILLTDGEMEKIVSSGEGARRIVAAVSANPYETYFFIFWEDSNTLIGPSLSELPELLLALSEEKNLKLENAINLDGGTHAAYLTKEARISEISPIGSFFCEKGLDNSL